MIESPNRVFVKPEKLILIADKKPWPRRECWTAADLTERQAYWTGMSDEIKINRVGKCTCASIRHFSRSKHSRTCVSCKSLSEKEQHKKGDKDSFSRLARYVYFVSTPSDYIKIGTSTNVAGRMATLQTSSHQRLKLEAVVHGSYSLEFKLHLAFSRLRMQGEWFKRKDLILRFAFDEMDAIRIVG